MNLISLNEYKLLNNIEHDRFDAQITAVVPGMSQIALNYVNRDIGVVPVSATKVYGHDGSGVLEINDATVITTVAYQNGPTLAATDYIAHEQNGVINWLELPPARLVGMSPEMGFMRNLDTLPIGQLFQEPQIEVTATFGWRLESNGTRVPDDVKQAVAWAVENQIDSNPDVTSEAIATFSRQFSQIPARDAFSARGLAVLDAYQRTVLV